MLTCKIVHLKKIYKFPFDHFLIKGTVFVLIEKNVIKNQNSISGQNLQHTKQMLRKKNRWFQKDVQILF